MKTILIVDDEPAARYGIRRALEHKYRIAEADSAGAARTAVVVERPDVILLDMVMPGTSGLEVCRRLRGINPQVKVILTSGYSSGEVTREARLAGAVGFIGKPYSLEELSCALRRPESLTARASTEEPGPGLSRLKARDDRLAREEQHAGSDRR